MANFLRWALAALVLVGVALPGGRTLAAEGEAKDPKKIWAEGVEHFDRGEYEKAKAKFEEVLPLIDDRTAAALVERAGIKTMVRILARREVGRGPSLIWELYRKYYRRQMTDEDRIREVVSKVIDEKTPEVERWKLLHELNQIGQYAVPELGKFLGDKSDARRALVRIALMRIGTRGTLAMVKLLDTGSDLAKETLALALAEITPADPRSVPALKRLYDNPNTSSTLKENLARALAKITGLRVEDMGPFADYYYDAADRYYMERSNVPEEALEADGVVWKLGADGKLFRRTVPDYSWNEEIAEEWVFECLAHAPEYERIMPLLVSIELAQREETAAMLDAIKTSGAPPTVTERDKKLLTERQALLVDAKLLAEACGPRILYRAVGKSLMDNRPDVGAAAIELLPLVDPRGDILPAVGAVPEVVAPGKAPAKPAADKDKPAKKPWYKFGSGEAKKEAKAPAAEAQPAAPATAGAEGQPLIAALDAADDGVAVGAAVALSRMDPARPFPGSEKVASNLAGAISKSGPLQILIADEDDATFKEAKTLIEEHGWGVSRATGGRDALAKAAIFPPKDLLLLSAALKADLKAEEVIERLKKDTTLSLLPVGVLIGRAELTKEQARFGNVAMIAREDKGLDLKNALLKALGERGPALSKQKREALAVGAAEALLLLDPRRTQIRVADAIAACRAALVNRPDEVRNPCARVLGTVEAKEAASDLLKVFEAKTNSVTLRGNALWALARTDPALGKKALLQAQKDEKVFVLRDLAAQAFGASGPAVKEMTEFQQKCRMMRGAEGGLPEGGAAPAPAPAAEEKPAAEKPAEKPAAEKPAEKPAEEKK